MILCFTGVLALSYCGFLSRNPPHSTDKSVVSYQRASVLAGTIPDLASAALPPPTVPPLKRPTTLITAAAHFNINFGFSVPVYSDYRLALVRSSITI
ncbi:hypothetical protein QE152_g10029 [Popillia japonica]|uniref:Uncharacterized protein n=1 Tax=Popillia japonica TaxID=7064 RepID=A0AAW1LSK9_POPJA